MSQDPKALALEYLEAVSQQRFDKLEALLAPDLKCTGPSITRSSAGEFIAALKQLTAIHIRSDVQRVFSDGDDVCIIYDFVTDTPAGALPTIEWLHFEQGRIRAIRLYYDRLPWKMVIDEVMQRASSPSA